MAPLVALKPSGILLGKSLITNQKATVKHTQMNKQPVATGSTHHTPPNTDINVCGLGAFLAIQDAFKRISLSVCHLDLRIQPEEPTAASAYPTPGPPSLWASEAYMGSKNFREQPGQMKNPQAMPMTVLGRSGRSGVTHSDSIPCHSQAGYQYAPGKIPPHTFQV